MAYDPSGLFDALESKLAACGYVTGQIAEPKDPPAQRLGAVIFNGVEITHTTLDKGSGVVKFILRFYFNALSEPLEETEKQLARAVLQVLDDISQDFDLGDASARNFVPVGQTAPVGYQTVGGTMYRLCDLTIDILVNDLVTFTK